MSEEHGSPLSGEILSFSQFVQNLDEGGLHHDLTTGLVEVVAALNDARQAGTEKPVAAMTIKLAFKLDGQTIDVIGDFTTKLPKVKRERSTFWTTSANRLSRNNPKQQNLPFKDVTGERARDAKAI